MSTVYFCWLCDKPADPRMPVAEHYEDRRPLRFCSPQHWTSYLELACL